MGVSALFSVTDGMGVHDSLLGVDGSWMPTEGVFSSSGIDRSGDSSLSEDSEGVNDFFPIDVGIGDGVGDKTKVLAGSETTFSGLAGLQ